MPEELKGGEHVPEHNCCRLQTRHRAGPRPGLHATPGHGCGPCGHRPWCSPTGLGAAQEGPCSPTRLQGHREEPHGTPWACRANAPAWCPRSTAGHLLPAPGGFDLCMNTLSLTRSMQVSGSTDVDAQPRPRCTIPSPGPNQTWRSPVRSLHGATSTPRLSTQGFVPFPSQAGGAVTSPMGTSCFP